MYEVKIPSPDPQEVFLTACLNIHFKYSTTKSFVFSLISLEKKENGKSPPETVLQGIEKCSCSAVS